jgi:predicted acyltransferase
MTEHKTETQSARVAAVDALRGLAIACMFFVGYPADKTFVNPTFRHAKWFGFHFSDAIYPCFLFVVGISLALGSSKPPLEGEWKKAITRALRLFCLGLFLRSISYSTPYLGLGTLQCIALAYLIAFPLRRASPRGVVAAIAAFFLGYLLLITAVLPPAGEFELRWEEGHTVPEWVDTVILGQPRGPEGVITTVMAGTCVLFGLLAGRHVQFNRRKLLGMSGVTALGAALFGTVLGVPLSPQLFTPTYVLLSMSVATLLLLALSGLTEVARGGAAQLPRAVARGIVLWLTIYGSNAIGVYAFLKMFHKWILLTWTIGDPPVTLSLQYKHLLFETLPPASASYGYAVTMVWVGWGFCYLLWRRGMFLRV